MCGRDGDGGAIDVGRRYTVARLDGERGEDLLEAERGHEVLGWVLVVQGDFVEVHLRVMVLQHYCFWRCQSKDEKESSVKVPLTSKSVVFFQASSAFSKPVTFSCTIGSDRSAMLLGSSKERESPISSRILNILTH